jgi:hypothetical protein
MKFDLGEEFGQLQRFQFPAFDVDRAEIGSLIDPIDDNSRVSQNI